MKSHFLVNTS